MLNKIMTNKYFLKEHNLNGTGDVDFYMTTKSFFNLLNLGPPKRHQKKNSAQTNEISDNSMLKICLLERN